MAICRHISLLASAPPRPTAASAVVGKPIQNGPGGGAGGKGPLLASSSSGGVGGDTEAAVGGGEEAALTMPELSRIGFEVSGGGRDSS